MPENRYTPCIILPGIGQSKVEMVDKNGQKIKMAWPLDINGEELFGKLKAPLMKMMLFRKDGGFSDKVASVVKEAIDPIAVNTDGAMKNRIKVVSYPYSLAKCTADERRYIYKMVPLQKLSAVIGEENLYFFAYNSFGQPYETAEELDKFIQQVKEETGSDKVNLVPVSLGGALSTAYFDAYGYKNDVKRVMYFVAALQGSRLIGDIVAKNIDTSSILPIVEIFGSKSAAEKLGGMLGMLPEGVEQNIVAKLLDALLETTIINCPSMWSIIPPEMYPELADRYLSDKKLSVVREKADRYYNAQKNIREMITERMNNGTEFFAICGYNLQLVPISNSKQLCSDTIINTSSCSLGATTADLGTTLESGDEKYMSPDRTVDASTGFLKDRTWYFKDQQHDNTAYNDTALEIAKRVLSDDGFTDVWSDEDLPQFGVASDNRK